MARVPNIDAIALSEVIGVIDDDPKTGSVTSVTDNGSGYARMHTASTAGLVLGRWVDLTGFSYGYGGSWIVTAISTNSYFDIDDYYYGDDSGTWTALIDSLLCCFANALSAKFDPAYEGSKDRLSNFRNYGWGLVLTQISTYYEAIKRAIGIDGCTGWIFVALVGDSVDDNGGLHSFTINSSGVLSFKDNWVQLYADFMMNIWVADSDNFVFCLEGNTNKVRSFTYDGTTGVITARWNSGPIYTGPLRANYSDRGNTITGDDNKFIFFLTNPQASPYYDAIITCEYDSNADLTDKTAKLGYVNEKFNGIWYDDSSGFLFTVGNHGLSSWSINQTTGALTLLDSDLLSYYCIDVWTDGTYAYVSTTDLGLIVYSWDGSGNLTYEDYADTLDSSAIYAISGDIDNGFIYAQGADSKIHIFSFVDGVVYCHGETTTTVTNMSDIHVPYDVADVIAVVKNSITSPNRGISTYKLT